jgi:hypothetical protein
MDGTLTSTHIVLEDCNDRDGGVDVIEVISENAAAAIVSIVVQDAVRIDIQILRGLGEDPLDAHTKNLV